ncbi:hypothetical protein CKAN_01759400 [Cinnamomum micranthum f. kanehirae]|uniref:DUF659 domain-containing protein n=1 Tax=Cinnamomum micranthum f. kanehirae TaxID=337451 RepID=A0A3S3NAX3_9MAGN|nr:hypothetical protein CKAN_01759400 [Cinnamomum micranthum f. kanehirae]
MPSYHDLRGKILGKIALEVNAFMEHYKSCWSETGCSVMADGWTDERQRTLINFLVYCPKGVMFLKSVDASPTIKNSDAHFKIFDEIVLLVGPNNIVQFIIDNDATYKAAGKRVAEKYGTFYWTACAAHCIDLMLEDMAKAHLFPVNASTIETARKIRNAFLYRKELRQMFTSSAWVESNASSTPVGIEITEIILNNTFWKDVEHILKVSEALVVVLRLAESEEKPAMGYVGKSTSQCTTRCNILFESSIFLSPTFSKHSEVMRGLNNVIEKLVPDFDTQDMIFKQCDAYKDSRFDFGSTAAIQNGEKIASGCERNWSIFEHIHSPKRNRLEHQRLNDLVFVYYNLKLHERDMLKRTSNAASDPISLENINILADWVTEEAPLLTIEDVDG